MWIGWTFSPRLKRKFNSIKYMYRVADISWLVFRRSLVSSPLSSFSSGGGGGRARAHIPEQRLVILSMIYCGRWKQTYVGKR